MNEVRPGRFELWAEFVSGEQVCVLEVDPELNPERARYMRRKHHRCWPNGVAWLKTDLTGAFFESDVIGYLDGPGVVRVFSKHAHHWWFKAMIMLNDIPSSSSEDEVAAVSRKELKREGPSELKPEGTLSELKPEGTLSELKPEDPSELKTENISELKPEGPSELKPEGPSELKPEGPSELKPEGPSELKLESTSKPKTENISELKPEGTLSELKREGAPCPPTREEKRHRPASSCVVY